MAKIFAARIVREPPEQWAIQVREPVEWSGFYESVDGVAWNLRGEPVEALVPTEARDRVIRNLRALVKKTPWAEAREDRGGSPQARACKQRWRG